LKSSIIKKGGIEFMTTAINKKDVLLVKRDTGEFLETLDKYEHDKRVQKAKNAHVWTKHGKKFTWARMEVEAFKELEEVLSTSHLADLLMLQSFMDYDGIIKVTSLYKEGKTTMSTTDMMNVLGLPERTFYDFLKACLDNKIIIKDDDCNYSINKKFYFRGEIKGDKRVTMVYREQVRRLYKSVKRSDLGLLCRLIPYIHLQTNTICLNPFEEDPTKLQKLNRKQICELLGISRPTFNRILDLEYDGQVVLAEVKIKRGKKKSYLVNPWVFYRMKIAPNDSLIGQEVNPHRPDATLLSIFSNN
jgi:hypothetical protein